MTESRPEYAPPRTPSVAGNPPAPHISQSLPHPNLIVALLLAALPMAGQLVVGVGVSAIAAAAFVVITGRAQDLMSFLAEFQVLMLPIGTLTTLVIAVAMSLLVMGRQTWRCLGWRGFAPRQAIWVVLLTFPLAVLASEATNCVAEVLARFQPPWLRGFRETGGELFGQFVQQPWLMVFVAGCLLPGLGEEIYCRGLISRGLVARYGVVAGTLLASALFGLMHLEPVQASGAFLLGIGLQFVFLATRSLAAPIVLHTLNNTLAFVTMRHAEDFPLPGMTEFPDGTIVHTPPLLLLVATATLICLVALIYQTRTRWQLPDGTFWSPGYITAEMPPGELAARPLSEAAHWSAVAACCATYLMMIAAVILANRSVAG